MKDIINKRNYIQPSIEKESEEKDSDEKKEVVESNPANKKYEISEKMQIFPCFRNLQDSHRKTKM